MRQQTTISPAQFAEVSIKIPLALEEQAEQFARQHGETISELLCMALASYLEEMNFYLQPLDDNDELRLNEARALVREFGKGLGEGRAPHDGAREHDRYLYAHTQKCRPFGNAKGMIKIADDFDEPLADFQEYMK